MDSSSKAYYDEHGYAIFRQAIPADQIDALLAEYRDRILPSRAHFFRQSSNAWEKNRVSSDGYSQSSFLDFHDLRDFETFSLLAKTVFCSADIRKALTELTGSAQHKLMQSMFFDQNTATPAHQDYYYLDTVPNGSLLAGWFALEDIDEKAGRFFVVPGSNQLQFELTDDERVSTIAYVKRIRQYLDRNQIQVFAPALKKGDVLFWNSRTIHGSLPTQDPRFSRKSLTAHYIPAELEFGNFQGVPFHVDYGAFEGMEFRLNPKIYSPKDEVKYGIKNFLDRHPSMRRIADSIKDVFAGQ